VKYVIFDSFSVSWTFYEKPYNIRVFLESFIGIQLYQIWWRGAQNHNLNLFSPIPKSKFRYPVLPNLLEMLLHTPAETWKDG
jgi:hypothetical protein